ncbi:MAG: ROK family transcriptional regulator [Litoreibacter sp.]
MPLKESVRPEEAEKETVFKGCGPRLNLNGGIAAKSLRQQIFERIRASGHISRIDIAKQLGVSPGSVTQAASGLLGAGLLQEVETPHDGAVRGRPPVALSIAPGARYVVGMKMGDFTHSAVIIDLAGSQVAEIDMRGRAQKRSAKELLSEADALLEAILSKAKLSRDQISAVGMGVAGMVDHQAGVVPWSPILLDRNIQLRDLMTEHLGVSVHIDNDANMLTLAELWFGAGRNKSSFAVVTIEYGVGMGLVFDNQLYRGSQGLGLELGHTKVQLDGALCRCGNRGCLEAYVADYALVREARIALNMNPETASRVEPLLDNLYEHAKSGNENARMIFRRAGRYLAAGLSNVVHLFDPGLIILSGERMRYEYLYSEEVMQEMEALNLDKGRAPTQVDIHVWGGYVWARGGAALALQALTDETFLNWDEA